MTDGRGVVLSEDAYAQGKMLDHSEWFGRLPRGSTPSDIDMVYDNASKVLYCELNRNFEHWMQVNRAQRWMYENILIGSENCSVLLRHDVGIDRKIKTASDIISFHPIVWSNNFIIASRIFYGSSHWQRFVYYWSKTPNATRAYILRDCAEKWLANCPTTD